MHPPIEVITESYGAQLGCARCSSRCRIEDDERMKGELALNLNVHARWIAYTSDETGRPVPTAGGRDILTAPPW